MSDEIIYSNLESKPCAGCEVDGIIWAEWGLSNDGIIGDRCVRCGCRTQCSVFGDCRCVEYLRETRDDTDCADPQPRIC